jgi:hypothetical protein
MQLLVLFRAFRVIASYCLWRYPRENHFVDELLFLDESGICPVFLSDHLTTTQTSVGSSENSTQWPSAMPSRFYRRVRDKLAFSQAGVQPVENPEFIIPAALSPQRESWGEGDAGMMNSGFLKARLT